MKYDYETCSSQWIVKSVTLIRNNDEVQLRCELGSYL